MLFFQDLRRHRRLNGSRKNRLRISAAERLQLFMPTKQIVIEFGKCQFMIKMKPRPQFLVGQQLARSPAKRFSKIDIIVFLDRQSGRHFVPAKFF